MPPNQTAAPTPTMAPPAQPPHLAELEKPLSADDRNEKHTDVKDPSGNLTVQQVLEMFDDAKKYVDSGLRTKWDNYFRVYKGQRVIRNYEGISDPVVRESHTIIETLVANIAGGTPKFHFVKTNEEQTDDVDVLNGMLDYYIVYNQMGLKNQEWVRDMLLYGTGVLYVTWRDGRPCIENIPLRDFFVDPTSTGMIQTINPARYAGYVYLADKEVLSRQMVYDSEEDKMVPRYKNLEKIGFDKENNSGGAGAENGHEMDKVFKDAFAGSTLGDKATERQVYVICLHDLMTGRVYEVGNRKEFIYNEKTWCQREELEQDVEVEVDGEIVPTKRKLDKIDPFLPFAVLRDYIDSSQFYGEGEMAVIMQDNELLNDYEAMDIDNNAYQNTPMYWVDPQFADLAPEIETIPGAVYPIPRNAMGALERPQLSGDLEAKKLTIQQRMRRATAADEAVQGVAQQKGRVTATEVQSQLNQANTRFATKIANLESEGYAQLGLILFKLVQIFVTKRSAVRIVGRRGVYFKDYDPWEFNGEWEAHVELDTTIKQKEMEAGMRDEKNKELMLNNPIFNQVEIHRYFLQKNDPELSDERFNEMLAPPAPPEEPNPFENVTINYKDATPWTKYQIEKKMELTPDPSHLGEQELAMLEQANRGADLMNPMTDASGGLVPGMESLLPGAGGEAPAAAPEGMPTPAVAEMM